MPDKVFFNGYFTKEHINGVPRYAYETLKRIDMYFAPGEAELVCPKGAKNIPPLENISINTWEKRGKIKECNGLLWGELFYEKHIKKEGLNVNLSNRAEKIPNSLTMIYDLITLYRYDYEFKLSATDLIKANFHGLIDALWFKYKIAIKKKYSRKIVTISNFSKEEINSKEGIPLEKIDIIGCGWEHILDIEAKDENLDPRIMRKQYYFAIGNIKPHKNFRWIINQAENMPNDIFVIAGKIPSYISDAIENSMQNVIFLGHISDSYMKYLMNNAKALLYPSYIEGFGIPPLEAMALGTPSVVADIPVMHEVYADSVGYINPDKTYDNLDNYLKLPPQEIIDNVLRKNSWNNTAKLWFDLIDNARKE